MSPFQQKILKLQILNSHKLFHQSVLLGLWFLLLNYLGDSSVTFPMTLALIKSCLWPNITENSPNVMEWLLPGLVTLFGKEHQTVMEKTKTKRRQLSKMSELYLKVRSERLKFPIGGTTIINKKLSSNSVGIFKSHFEQFITTQPGYTAPVLWTTYVKIWPTMI